MKFFRKISISLALGAVAFSASSSALAALPQGSKAPDFSLSAVLAGKPFDFSLREALRKGPVILYFFPAAFTQGCTIEAHLFAEATDDFKKMGATVIGVTAGGVDRIAEFSRSECRDKFAVAADPGAKIAARYDALLRLPNQALSDRTSFVIAPNGTILLSYTEMNPQQHIERTMATVRHWRANRR